MNVQSKYQANSVDVLVLMLMLVVLVLRAKDTLRGEVPT